MNPTYIQNHISHLFEPDLIAEISHEGTQANFKAGDEILEREVLEFFISRKNITTYWWEWVWVVIGEKSE